MGAPGKKYMLKFDPRTELLFLVLANVVAFTQHSLWVEITWVVLLLLLIIACGCTKAAGRLALAFGICLFLQYGIFPIGPKILASSFTILVSYARRAFPCLIVGTLIIQKTPVKELMVALRKCHIPQGLIIPTSTLYLTPFSRISTFVSKGSPRKPLQRSMPSWSRTLASLRS